MTKQPDKDKFVEAIEVEVDFMFREEIWKAVPKRVMREHYQAQRDYGLEVKRHQIMMIWSFKRKRHPMVPLTDSDAEILPTGTGGIGSEASPLEQYEYRERLGQMNDALENRLSKEQRQLFELHHLESLSISQIADTLSKSEDAVKSNLYRARKLLLAR